jgi:hypothetical protein
MKGTKVQTTKKNIVKNVFGTPMGGTNGKKTHVKIVFGTPQIGGTNRAGGTTKFPRYFLKM